MTTTTKNNLKAIGTALALATASFSVAPESKASDDSNSLFSKASFLEGGTQYDKELQIDLARLPTPLAAVSEGDRNAILFVGLIAAFGIGAALYSSWQAKERAKDDAFGQYLEEMNERVQAERRRQEIEKMDRGGGSGTING